MTPKTRDQLIDALRQTWESLDPSLIEDVLANNLHYYSWWAMVEFNKREDYLIYLRERFLAYRRSDTHPIVKLGINKNDGEHAVALQFGDEVPILIRIKEENGMITEMWKQPAE